VVPAPIEIIIEPGRLVSEGAGFACGTIVVVRELDDRPLYVLDLSRICHLRWSQVELVAQAPHPGEGRRALFVGPTCFEDDVVGEWTVTPAHLHIRGRVVLRGVSGYAVAWNTSFGGVPAAEVVIGDANRLLE
jgi:diaminopimelate decarboxylase